MPRRKPRRRLRKQLRRLKSLQERRLKKKARNSYQRRPLSRKDSPNSSRTRVDIKKTPTTPLLTSSATLS